MKQNINLKPQSVYKVTPYKRNNSDMVKCVMCIASVAIVAIKAIVKVCH